MKNDQVLNLRHQPQPSLRVDNSKFFHDFPYHAQPHSIIPKVLVSVNCD